MQEAYLWADIVPRLWVTILQDLINGTAKFFGPLSVDDFVKKSQYTYYTKEALSKVAEDVAFFAEKEGLSAHARSATVRFIDEAK